MPILSTSQIAPAMIIYEMLKSNMLPRRKMIKDSFSFQHFASQHVIFQIKPQLCEIDSDVNIL